MPRPLGALILKAAAYTTDSRDRERHLFDAAALLACIDDPFAERVAFSGSDCRRIATLVAHLDPGHRAWRALSDQDQTQAQLALDILAGSGEESVAESGSLSLPLQPRSVHSSSRSTGHVVTTRSRSTPWAASRSQPSISQSS